MQLVKLNRWIAAIFLSFFSVAVVDQKVLIADWNQWRGANRDGKVATSLPETLDGLSLAWQHSLEPSYSGPIVSGDLVFTTETVEKKFERVTAHNLQSGEMVWQQRWDGAMSVPFFAAANGDWIRATPATNGDVLIVMGMRDVLVAFDVETGKKRWRVDFPKALGTKLPSFGAVCSPLIDGDYVYVQTGGPTVKLSLADGSVVWKTLSGGDSMMSAGAFSSPVIAELQGLRQLVVQTRAELCGVDLNSGEPLWRQPVEAFRGMNILTPTVIGDKIFTAAHSGKSHLFQVKRSNDQWSASELWSQKTQGYMSSPVVLQDQIYLHAKNQRLVTLNLADGGIGFTSKPFGKYWSMVTDGDQIMALDADGTLRLIANNPTELTITNEQSVGDNSWAHVAVTPSHVIVRNLKEIKAFRWSAKSGQPTIKSTSR